MKFLLSILRSVHCRSTHHYFAIDSLPLVQTEPGKRLARILVRHHRRFLIGCKDPDTRFRDYQNHVIHVTDGYWGGAPRVAHAWYNRLQRYLREERWSDAAHAAGVLSHYFTDPLQPLHTQQSDREKIVHRPIEWAIYRCYDQIFRRWKDDDLRIVFQLSDASGWLGEAMLHTARFSNRKCESLLEQFDIDRTFAEPPKCLSSNFQQSVAELFGLAITGLARLFERAAAEAEAVRRRPLPTVRLSLPSMLAATSIPYRYWMHRLEDRFEQQAVAQLIDEFNRTGDVVEHLPAEVDIVHRVNRVRDDEKRWRSEREQRLLSQETEIRVESDSTPSEPSVLPFSLPTNPQPAHPDCQLSRADTLAAAPSIGPKTADRFAAIGIKTVGSFLEASADEMSSELATYWITRKTVVQWQHQASLMCTVPGLRPRDAQLLVGASCGSIESLASQESAPLFECVVKYCGTSAGKRYLRGAKPPSRQQVASWIHSARQAGSSSESERLSA